ncbi:MAG: FAD-dependent oxidoreductase [Egibacteraceae bacterium]
MSANTEYDVLVVGGGLAGLSCALRLRARGREPVVLEASDDVGGRVRTDVVDGFQLDRGFQVLLTAYPEARRVLDYGALNLRSFSPGVLVRRGRGFHPLSDPFRRPGQALVSAISAVGQPRDKLRLMRLRLELGRAQAQQLRNRPDIPTIDALRGQGFSDRIIESFFRPFLGSVFFDWELATSSRMYAFVMRSFFQASVAVPAAGMRAIPAQLAAGLPEGSVRLGTEVAELGSDASPASWPGSAAPAAGSDASPASWPGSAAAAAGLARVILASGDRLTANAVVVATEATVAATLVPSLGLVRSRSAAAVYFAAPKPPMDSPTLMLDGERSGPAKVAAVLSNVAPSYAPAGQSLIAAAVIGDHEEANGRLEAQVRQQMRRWFGMQVDAWRHLRTYRIPYALPDQTAPMRLRQPVRIDATTFVCGDHRDTGSIQGALVSGRRTADAVAGDRRP